MNIKGKCNLSVYDAHEIEYKTLYDERQSFYFNKVDVTFMVVTTK